MNSIKLQDTKITSKKSAVILYINDKISEKLKHLILNSTKNNKILRNKFNQKDESSLHWKEHDFEERN